MHVTCNSRFCDCLAHFSPQMLSETYFTALRYPDIPPKSTNYTGKTYSWIIKTGKREKTPTSPLADRSVVPCIVTVYSVHPPLICYSVVLMGNCKSGRRCTENLEGDVKFFAFPRPKTEEERCWIGIRRCVGDR